MASRFISASDPTGEMTLRHWVSVGQLQDHPTQIEAFAFGRNLEFLVDEIL